MGVFSIFGSKESFDPNVFEKELTSITEKINTNKQQISKLQQRQKYVRRSLSRYFIIIYLCIFGYCYATIPSSTIGKNRVQWFIRGQTRQHLLVLIGYPLFSVLTLRAVSYIFQFFINNKQSYLKSLQNKHKEKIEELKKITNFNKTNELINKYGNEKQPQVSLQKQEPQPISNQKQQDHLRNRHNKSGNLRDQAMKELNLQEDKQLSSQQKGQLPNTKQAPIPAIPQQPAQRTIQDRLLDILIGSDNSESVENRYALICFHCFAHNGLAPPHTEDPADAKFQCWKCGAMNGKGMLFEQPDMKFDSSKNSSSELINLEVKEKESGNLDHPGTENEEKEESTKKLQ
ncbi:hypothetical protein MEO_02833 [Candida albicans P94015]|nr:hypothetical protein MEO_02833 [Candida albicans P94015]